MVDTILQYLILMSLAGSKLFHLSTYGSYGGSNSQILLID
jgi:hypothetical protein